MKTICIAFAVVLLIGCTNQQETGALFPKGELIDNTHFNGKAWVNRLVSDKAHFDLTVGNVLFEPGARTSWHLHPGGQILICTRGLGRYQEEGKPIQFLNKGDVVEILPNIVHWHGATADSEFEHIAIGAQSSKGGVEWLQD